MKIVRIIARLNVGGPAIHVVLLTSGLQKNGHESQLIVGPVPPNEGNMEYYAASHGVTFTQVPELVRPLSPWRDLMALIKIYALLRRERPDVVHTHTSKAGTVGRAAAILARTPVIFHTFHGSVFEGYFSPAQTRMFLGIERLLARFTDRVITVSALLRSQLSETYRIAPSEKIEVIRLGFDLTDLCEVAGMRVHRNPDPSKPLTIGWIGRLTDIKDPLLFIELAAALKSAGHSPSFVVIGDGPLRTAVEQRIADHNLSPCVRILGWRHDMPRVYTDIDLVISTSVNEGTPVALIEAMATGCPFVATNVGGVADLVTGAPERHEGFSAYSNGILTEDRSIGSLVRAVEFVAPKPELRKQMGATGHQFAVENFRQERLVRDIESLYLRFLNPEARARSAERSSKD